MSYLLGMPVRGENPTLESPNKAVILDRHAEAIRLGTNPTEQS